ncbi:MAG: MFS transporter [Phycisphaerales bacterium]|nr:MAG: MFS transporter [Phycisphaerales bacterium]
MKSNLVKRGFLSLLVTQFFGAANDNVLKQVLSYGVAMAGIWAAALGRGGQAYVALCLTVPFILLSGYGGQLADRHSKQRITVIVKIAEVFIACFVLAGFVLMNIWMLLVGMVLLAVQSTFFGPAKYGMIPELVEGQELSRANGLINMLTNIAVITGTLIAGPLYKAYHPESDPDFVPGTGAVLWLPGAAMIVIAIGGLIASTFLTRLEAKDPHLKFDWNPVGTYWAALKEMSRSPLLIVAVAWSYFYLIAMIAMLILPDYKTMLNIDTTETSYLFVVLAVSIGLGSVLAGFISGRHIEPRLIPIGAVGMTVFFVLLGLLPLHYFLVAGLLLGAGVFAGFYIVPLQALLQYLSPVDERGRFLGTANAVSFVCLSIGSLIFLFARAVLDLSPNRIFLICAGLAFIGIGFMIWRLRGLMTDPNIRRPAR